MTTTTASGRIPARTELATRLRERARSLILGRRGALAWERPALLGLLAVTAAMYIWDLGASGWANSFYSAAVQAGSTNWEAFLFGSSDAANSITVDKPPMSLWFMALSVRLFGLSPWSILLPQALMGVATVAVLYATLRRRFSAGIALLGGTVLALTPVAALMFRFNNPDALLTLLMTLAAYFTVRAIEAGRLKWLVLAGVMIGLGFLTKQLQAFLVLPPLALAYLWAAPRPVGIRIRHGLVAVGAMVISFGWWVAIVEVVPASMRPWIGGSQSNSFLELTFGYNGLGRLTGDETGSVTGGRAGGPGAGGGMWGSTGITRLLDGEIGGQIAWLLPAALVLSAVAFALLRRAPRTSAARGILTVFVGWMLVTGVAFSFMAGIFHAYYTVALAPAIAAVVAIGSGMLWQRRDALWSRIAMAALLLGTAAWAWVLLARTSGWLPWLPYAIAVAAVLAAALIVANPTRAALGRAALGLALVAGLGAPTAYTLQTVTTPHSGSIVTAGPPVQGSRGGFGARPGAMAGGPGGAGAGNGFGPGGRGAGQGTQPGAGAPNGAGAQHGTGAQNGIGAGAPNGAGIGAGARPGGAGGLLGASAVSSALRAALLEDSGSYTWVAATVGSNSASGYQLATRRPVMAIGGFNGSDPSPTLARFQSLVRSGSIHYFIAGGVGRSNGGSSASSAISAWVAANFTATTIGGTTVYDLTR